MFIILEGPDCAGKTTLAHAITKYIEQHLDEVQHRVSFYHAGPPERSTYIQEYIRPLVYEYDVSNTYHHLIIDRWHVGEMVYPRVLMREPLMNKRQYDVVNRIIHDMGALIVFVMPPLRVIIDRLAQRGDDIITSNEQLRTIYTLYSQLYASYAYEKMRHSAVHDVENAAAHIVKVAMHSQLDAIERNVNHDW